jgi:hypothetical protein
MKSLILLTSVFVCLFSCNLASLGSRAPDCGETAYKPKSEAAIAVMSPTDLIDERVKAYLHRNSFDSFASWTDYGSLIEHRIREAGKNALPPLTDYINAYHPKNPSLCEQIRFSVGARIANDIDRFELRLRGTKEGQLAIGAVENAIDRMKEAGFEDRTNDYDNKRRFGLEPSFLRDMKGINEADNSIRETFWVKRKMKISESELLEFGNFLISRDPTYPSWSRREWFKDYSRANGGLPLQVLLLTRPERFYEEYKEFKKFKSAKKLK